MYSGDASTSVPEPDPAVVAAIGRAGPRVELITGAAGGRFWLKRVEVLDPKMRLQKGDPRRAFDAERQGLKLLGGLGLPVVPLLAEGADWFVTADCGPTVDSVVTDPQTTKAEVLVVMAAVGQALARLHRAGYAHGRPVMRDICWNGVEARFIDLERFSPGKPGYWARPLDVAMLVQSWFTAFPGPTFPGPTDGIDRAVAQWSAGVDTGLPRRLVALGWVLGWLGPLTAPVRWIKPAAREFQALPLALDYLRRSAR